jgi:hypothetical protein
MIEGGDYSYDRPDPACLYANGWRFVVRYVSYSTTTKNMTLAEVGRLTRAGLSICTVWQDNNARTPQGRAMGERHARDGARMHRDLGGPEDRPLYFAIDHDATTSQLATWWEYIQGCNSVIGRDRVGVYGGRRTIAYMAERGVRWLWQTAAWSGGVWDPRAQIQQYRVDTASNPLRLCGGAVDYNRATVADYGQWGQPGDPTEDVMTPEQEKRLLDAIAGIPRSTMLARNAATEMTLSRHVARGDLQRRIYTSLVSGNPISAQESIRYAQLRATEARNEIRALTKVVVDHVAEGRDVDPEQLVSDIHAAVEEASAEGTKKALETEAAEFARATVAEFVREFGTEVAVTPESIMDAIRGLVLGTAKPADDEEEED